MGETLLSVEGVSVQGWLSSKWLRLPDFTLASGESCAIVGLAGTGKTAMAHALAGLPFRSNLKGRVFFGSSAARAETTEDSSAFVAFVPNRPRLVFSGLRSTLREEMLLTLQFLNRPSRDAAATVNSWADALGVSHLLDRTLTSLSGGEAVLGALAVALVKNPRVVILDGIYDFLFPETRRHIRRVLSRLVSEGALLVETHAQPPDWLPEFDKALMLSYRQATLSTPSGTSFIQDRSASYFMTPVARTISKMLISIPADDLDIPQTVDAAAALLNKMNPTDSNRCFREIERAATQTKRAPNVTRVLSAEALAFAYPEAGFRLGPVTFDVSPQETLALVGPNGSGKTTLLKALACLLEPLNGKLRVWTSSAQPPAVPPPRNRRHLWAKSVIYCFQDPDDQLYLPTVHDELVSISKSIGTQPSEPDLIQLAGEFGLTPFLNHSPLDIPFPLRRLTAMGSALLARPPLLLLDEPTAGLDLTQIRSLQDRLREFAKSGRSCILISHDPDFTHDVADRAVLLNAGQIQTTASLNILLKHLPNESLPTATRIVLAAQSAPSTMVSGDYLTPDGTFVQNCRRKSQ